MKVTLTSKWLQAHRNQRDLAILDARSRAAYRKSHIKNAVHADLFHYFVPGTDPQGLKKFQNDLAVKLGKLGLTGKESVVVYESGFGMRAARIAWMLEFAGVKHVSLLEGGFRVWRKSRFPSEKGARLTKSSNFRIKPNPRILATAGEIRKNKSFRVLDVRSEGEFRGTEGRECDPRNGRIPNSRWLEWTSFVEGGRGFKDKKGVSSYLKRTGLTSNKTVVTYCHRGARAAAAFYALRSLGYRDVKNYIGSWHEWSSRNDLPVEK